MAVPVPLTGPDSGAPEAPPRGRWAAGPPLDHLARSAVAACRYARPAGSPRYEPAGQRGDAPAYAARNAETAGNVRTTSPTAPSRTTSTRSAIERTSSRSLE